MNANIDLRHWTDKGTALTNFHPDEEPRYLEALRQHGDESFVVVHEPMAGTPAHASHYYSLHYLDMPKDCGAFWRVFESVK